jgi:putative membrane protein
MFLTPADMQSIEARVAALEKDLGVEVVTLVVAKSDTYPETVWKAFALGASLTALVVTVGDILRPDWVTTTSVLFSVLAILGVGAAFAIADIYVPALTRLFIRDSRKTLEATQYAKAQFLERELFATAQRTAVLMLVSVLEQRVVILADKGFNARVTTAEWDGVISRMTPRLRAGAVGEAILAGLAALGELVAGKGIARGMGNAFSDAPIETDGAT